MIEFVNASKTYDDGTEAVKSLHLTIKKGELFVLIGPSGCGKTTTLKMINRLIPITGGTIFYSGEKISEFDIQELRWNMGLVLQEVSLFPHMTIEENIAIVPELKKWDDRKTQKRIDTLLKMVNLDPGTYRKRKPAELSGGQQQRIGVIRALAADPDIILMDEPFSSLDPISREKLQQDILNLQKKIQKTIIFVTHDMEEALTLGDRICLMDDGQVVQVDTPDAIIKDPANEFVAEFIGNNMSSNYIDRLKGEEITAHNLLSSLDSSVSNAVAVPAHTPLSELLPHLSDHEHISVVQKDQVIGTVTRKSVIEYLAERITGANDHE